MAGVDAVEVIIRRLVHWLARLREDMRGTPGPPREGNDRRAAIAAEFVGWRNNAAQGRSNRYAVQFRQDRIGGGAISVTYDDDRDLFGGQVTFGRFAASLKRFSRQARPFAFERFQNERLIALDDAARRLWLIASQRRQKPVPPAERRGGVHIAAARGLPQADAVDHCVGPRGPFVLHAQLRQRRLRQRVETAQAGFATATRQIVRLTPAHDVAIVAVWATNAVHQALAEVGNTGRAAPLRRMPWCRRAGWLDLIRRRRHVSRGRLRRSRCLGPGARRRLR